MTRIELVQEYRAQATEALVLARSINSVMSVKLAEQHTIAIARANTWTEAADRLEHVPIGLWIVGKHLTGESGGPWEFQGVFATEQEAIDACVKDEYFVGPAILGEAITDETETWPGCWYPRLEPKP